MLQEQTYAFHCYFFLFSFKNLKHAVLVAAFQINRNLEVIFSLLFDLPQRQAKYSFFHPTSCDEHYNAFQMQHIFTTSSIFQSKMLSLCEKSSHFACPFQTRIPKVPLKSWPFKISVALHPKSHSTLPVHSREEILRVPLKSLNLNISALQKKKWHQFWRNSVQISQTCKKLKESSVSHARYILNVPEVTEVWMNSIIC